MSVRTKDERQVNVKANYVEANVNYNDITFEIHDEWKEDRKRDPVYVMSLNLDSAEYMLRKLTRAWVILKNRKAKRLEESLQAIRRSLESTDE